MSLGEHLYIYPLCIFVDVEFLGQSTQMFSLRIFCQKGVALYAPPAVHESCRCSISLPTVGTVILFNFSHNGRVFSDYLTVILCALP